ncbi:MAG: hypothetical protein BZ137_03990 [Methanosphaera sp. rholeuAM130]|nr:MAG: hypothetical protein BZ137_03990 [Methanosphaera sp. rholeuAM130]
MAKNVNEKKDIPTENKVIGLNSTTFDTYVTNGEFNDLVSDGDTVDVNGKLDGERFALNVNKSLNFISSNNESYINVYTQSTGFYGEATGGQITFGHGASGSNITDLYFYNTRIVFSNTSNIFVNNISVIDYEANIGSGTGHFILNGGSDNITINNSYFYTKDNGQHSTVVFTGAQNCIFENNTIEAVGNVGNLVYINTFNSNTDDDNGNITIKNNLLNAQEAPSQMTCFAICIVGSNHLIENNTVIYNGTALSGIWSTADYENITIRNNKFQGSMVLGNSNGVVINSMKNMNIINNTAGNMLIDSANIINNTISVVKISGDNSILEGNNIKILNIAGNNNTINNNTISTMNEYAINVNGENNSITNNYLMSSNGGGDNAIINSSEVTTENNNNAQRYIYITVTNYLEYGYLSSNTYFNFNDSMIFEGDWIHIDNSVIDYLNSFATSQPQVYIYTNFINNLTFFNMTNDYSEFYILSSNSTFLNCEIPGVHVGRTATDSISILINTTIGFSPLNEGETDPYVVVDENSRVLGRICNNTYPFYYSSPIIINSTSHLFSTVTGKIKRVNWYAVNETGKIKVFLNENQFNSLVFVDRILDFEGVMAQSNMNNNITFIAGSSGSTLKNLVFKDYVILNESGIKFTNCTFNKGVIFNNVSDIEISGCIFNTTDMPILMKDSSENAIKNNIFIDSNEHDVNAAIYMENSSENILKNNKINTINQYTVYADDNSIENELTENVLSASTTKDRLSVFMNENNNYVESKEVRYPTTVNIEVNNQTGISIGDIVPITVNVFDEDGNPVTNGYVEIYADGIFNNNVNLTDGVCESNVMFNKASSNAMVKVWYYAEDTYYNSVSNVSGITVEKATVTITADDIIGYVDDTITLNAYITTDNGYVVDEGNVFFIFGDNRYSTEVVNGTATYDVTLLPEWTTLKKVNIQFYNATNFVGTTLKVIPTITIKKIQTQVSVDDISGVMYAPTTITATVTDENGTNMASGGVTFADDDGNIIAETTVNDGIATTTVTFNKQTDSTITVTFTPDSDDYDVSTASATLNIQKPVTGIIIDEITPTAGETITLTARVSDQLSNNITGGKIVFKINGKTLKDTNGKVIYAKVTNGIAQINYTIPESYADKNITIQATYSGCTKYDKQTAEITTFVTKPEATLTIDQLPDSIQANTNITIKAKVQLGTTPIATGKVIFKINGKTLKDANGKVIYVNVDSNGEAILTNYNLGNLKVGAYTLKAVFTASSYDKLEANETISIIA